MSASIHTVHAQREKPALNNLNIKKMSLPVFVRFVTAFWKPVSALVSAWAVGFLGEPIFLKLALFDWGLLAKIVPLVLTVVVTIAGWRWTSLKSKEEALLMAQERLHKSQDQYKENVDWLMAKKFITSDSTKDEIDRLLGEHFPDMTKN